MTFLGSLLVAEVVNGAYAAGDMGLLPAIKERAVIADSVRADNPGAHRSWPLSLSKLSKKME